MLKTRSPGRRFTFLQSPKSWLASVEVTNMTCDNGDFLAVKMLHQWLKSFCGAQRVGPGIEPYGKHSLKEGKIPMDIEIS